MGAPCSKDNILIPLVCGELLTSEYYVPNLTFWANTLRVAIEEVDPSSSNIQGSSPGDGGTFWQRPDSDTIHLWGAAYQ